MLRYSTVRNVYRKSVQRFWQRKQTDYIARQVLTWNRLGKTKTGKIKEYAKKKWADQFGLERCRLLLSEALPPDVNESASPHVLFLIFSNSSVGHFLPCYHIKLSMIFALGVPQSIFSFIFPVVVLFSSPLPSSLYLQ